MCHWVKVTQSARPGGVADKQVTCSTHNSEHSVQRGHTARECHTRTISLVIHFPCSCTSDISVLRSVFHRRLARIQTRWCEDLCCGCFLQWLLWDSIWNYVSFLLPRQSKRQQCYCGLISSTFASYIVSVQEKVYVICAHWCIPGIFFNILGHQ